MFKNVYYKLIIFVIVYTEFKQLNTRWTGVKIWKLTIWMNEEWPLIRKCHSNRYVSPGSTISIFKTC